MEFTRVIGHESVMARLRAAFLSGRITHAYLLIGQESVGKAPVARALAAALLCERAADTGAACQKCASCLRLASDAHPDLVWLSPEGAGEIIGIRTLRDRVYSTAIFAPSMGARKVFVLERADRLGLDAANSLLKILEEPPPYVHFVLTADSTAAMLSTVLSRCQQIRLGAVPADAIEEALRDTYGMDDASARLYARYAEGAPGKAISLAAEPERAAVLEDLAAFCSRLAVGKPGHALRLAEEFRKVAGRCKVARVGEDDRSSRLAYAVALDFVAVWLRDVLARAAAPEVADGDSADDRVGFQRAYAEDRGPSELRDALQCVMETRRAILGNANATMATDALFAELTRSPRRERQNAAGRV